MEQAETARLAKLGIDRQFKIVRLPADVIAEMVAHLESLRGEDGKFIRDLNATEQHFIDNELILAKLDFRHFCENYAYIRLSTQSDRPEGWDLLDTKPAKERGGPLGKFLLNGMQLALLQKLAELEEIAWSQKLRGVPVNGILLILLKARQLGACLVAGTRVLTADLRWVPIESVQVGDKLVALDEFSPGGKGPQRKLRVATVEATRSLPSEEVFKVILSNGASFTATAGHRFLSHKRGGSEMIWREVSEMVVGDEIRHLVAPWGAPDYEDGWFAGLLDGEGSLRGKRLSGRAHSGTELTVSQVAGHILDRAMLYLFRNGYKFREEIDNRKGGESSKLGNKPVHKFVLGRLHDIFSLVGKVRPERFVTSTQWWEEKELPTGPHRWAKIVSIERAGQQRVYDLQTDTKTFIAEGLVSHNSTFWQCLLQHRMTFYPYFQTLMAGVDDQDTQRLRSKSELVYNNLPFWMRRDCEIVRHQVDRGDNYSNGSLVELQDFAQEKDLGKGETWNGFHGTEISSCPANRYDDHFEEGLFHAIPYSIDVLFGMESTAKGKTGPWYDFCMQVLSGAAEGGAGRFAAFFAPFYLIDIVDEARGQRSKYRMEVPADWKPRPETLLVAEKVKESSYLYTPDHRTIELPLEVLRWYEVTRAMFYRRGKLNLFLQAYPITPDEAFQHGSAGAFTTEAINRLDLHCAKFIPLAYRLGTQQEADDWAVENPAETAENSAHPLLRVGAHALIPMSPDELDKDARGVIWLWELPDLRSEYYLGGDPAGGIPRWNRAFRTHNDINTDNGTIEVYRKGKHVQPCEDCAGRGWNRSTAHESLQIECLPCDGRGKIGGRLAQVAEYAAPIDPEELALYIWVLGKLFRGSADLDECLAVVENNNVGILTIRTLQNKYSYTNLWQSESVAKADQQLRLLQSVGWNSSGGSVPILHARSRIAVVRRDVEIRSPWLVKELSDAVVKIIGVESDKSKSVVSYERFMVPPGGGRHDDRMTGSFLAWWPALHWSEGDEYETTEDEVGREVPTIYNPAARDVTAAQQHRIWNDAVEAVFGEYDLDFGHLADCDVNCTADHSNEDDVESYNEEYEDSLQRYGSDDDDDGEMAY